MAKMVMSSGPNGKDMVIVASREELSAPSEVQLAAPEPAPGLVLPDGSINWGCPCLGGMATGPCGMQFRDAFSCFHYSEAEPKGSDCYEKFSVMQECMSHYPELYGKDEDDLGLPSDSTPRDLAAADSTPRDLAGADSTPRDLAGADSTPHAHAAAESTPTDKAAGDAVPTKGDE